MFRQDWPIVTIVTPHAGCGCQHGPLLLGVKRRFWAAAQPDRDAVFGHFYVIAARNLSTCGARLRKRRRASFR